MQVNRHAIADRLVEEIDGLTRSIKRIGLVDPPTFSGGRTESFEGFMQRFNEYANASQWNYADAARIYPTLLKGRAKELYLLIDFNIRQDWEQMLTIFKNLLLTPANRVAAQERLLRLQQDSGEGFLTFYYRIRDAAHDAYDRQRDQLAAEKAAILRGANPALKKVLLRMPGDATIVQLLEKAIGEEDLDAVVQPEGRATLESLSKKIDGLTLAQREAVSSIQTTGGSNRSWRSPGDRQDFQPQSSTSFVRNRGSRWINWKRNKKKFNQRGESGQKKFSPKEERNSAQGEGQWIWRPNKPRTRNSRSSVRSVPLYLAIVAALLCFSGTAVNCMNATYVLCDTSREGFLLAPPRVEDCSTTSVTPLLVQASVFARSDNYKIADAYSCSKRTTEVCASGKILNIFSSPLLEHQTIVEPLDEERCRRMKATRRMDAVPLYQEHHGRWTSDLPIFVPKPFISTMCRNTTNYLLLEGQIAWSDPAFPLSDLGDLSGCHVAKKTCEKTFYRINWNADSETVACQYEERGVFNAMVTEKLIIIEDLQMLASFETDAPSTDVPCVSPLVWHLSNGLIVTFPNITQKNFIRKFVKENPISVKHANIRRIRINSAEKGMVNLESPVALIALEKLSAIGHDFHEHRNFDIEDMDRELFNLFVKTKTMTSTANPLRSPTPPVQTDFFKFNRTSLVQVVVNAVDAQIKKTFESARHQLCEAHNNQAMLVSTLAVLNPTAAVRVLLRRNDVAAKFAGDVFSVSLCTTITPNAVMMNYSLNGLCFQEIPIVSPQGVFYVVPGSNELTRTGTPVPCEATVDAVYRLPNGQFSTDAGLKDVRMFPSWTSPENPLSLIFAHPAPGPAPGGYQAPESEGRIARHLEEVEELQETFAHAFGGQYKEIKESIAEETEDSIPWYSAISNKLSRSWDDAVDAGKNAVNSYVQTVKDTLVSLLLWIVVPILVTVAGILTIYVLARCWWTYHKQKSFARALAEAQDRTDNTELLRSRPPRPPPPTKGRRKVAAEDEIGQQETALINAIAVNVDNEERPARGFGRTPLFTFIPLVCAVREHPAAASLPYVRIFINNKPIVALLDTGSSVSFISKSTSDTVAPDSLFPPSKQDAKAANGTQISFIGSINALIQLGTTSCFFRTQVTKDEDCPGPAVLGVDLLRILNRNSAKIEMNFDDNYIVIGEEKLPILKPGEVIEKEVATYCVTVAQNVTLEPATDNVVWSKIDSSIPHNWELLIEEIAGKADQDKKPFIVGRTLAHVKEGTVPVRLLNMSSQPICLWKGQKIAKAEVTASADQTVSYVQHVPPEADWEEELPRGPMPNFDIGDALDLEASIFSEKEKQRLRNIARRNSAAFVGADGKIGRYTGPVRHEIRLIPGAKPPSLRPYRVPLEKRMEIENQLKKMLQDGLIRPSKSAFAAPVVLVKKKDGSWRFTIDYRKLNKVTEKESYYLPLIIDILDLVGGKKIYSTFDLQSGYFQIPLAEEDTPKTAFTTFAGQFEFLVLSQGLCGAPSTFARCMADVLRSLKAAAFVYLDDIVLASSSTKQHLVDIEELLKTLASAGLKLRHDKCHFGQAEVPYLGFLLSEEGVRVNPEKTAAVKKFPAPKSVKELRQFLGAAGHYRRFIHRYADLASPLTKLLKKDVPYIWTEDQESAFEALKSALTSAPVLRSPRLGQPFEIHTDASKAAVAGCLLQKSEEGNLHVIAFASRRLNCHEERYPAIEMEALAVVFSVKAFAPYIIGAATTVVTDHAPLRALLDRQDLDGRLMKYQMSLAPYDLKIIYRPGRWNELADALSRNPPESNANAVVMPKERLMFDDLLNAQTSFDSQSIRPFYYQKNGIWMATVNGEEKIVVPPTLRQRLMEETHEDPLEGGHLGSQRLGARLQKNFTWPKMQYEIRQFARSCRSCQLKKTPGTLAGTEPLGEVDIPTAPMDHLHLDFLGPYPLSMSGNRYVHVVVDNFTKMAYVDAVPDTKTVTLIESFLKNIIYKEGCPKQITTDQGAQYMSKEFAEILELLGIEHRTSSPYHHQSNGCVERYNRTLGDMIAIYAQEKAEDWDNYILPTTFAYNTTPHAELDETPFFLAHGRDAILPSERLLWIRTPKYADQIAYKFQMASNIKDAFALTSATLLAASHRRKLEYDETRNARPKVLQIDDLVVVRAEVPPGTSSKLSMPWKGPFRVTCLKRPTVTVVPLSGGKPSTVHINRCKRYNSTEPIAIQLRKVTPEAESQPSGGSTEPSPNDDRVRGLRRSPRLAALRGGC